MKEITQAHRITAASNIPGDDQKAKDTRKRIINGDWDHHPAVEEAVERSMLPPLALSEPVAWAFEWKPWSNKNPWQADVAMKDPRINPVREIRNVVELYASPAPNVAGPTAEQERLRFEGDLDKWMKTIGAGITGYQPEAYAVMDLACHELVKLRAMLSFLNNNVGLELVWQEVNGDPSECGWHLFRRFGGRSDRDFKIVGTGETVEEAIKHAMEGSL